jgi:hypothetical protein
LWAATAPLNGAVAATDLGVESARIVSQHRAVFTKAPRGAHGFSTDAILLGNGDITMAISSTPLERDSKLKHQEPGKIRFWFTKNDLWRLGGRTSSKLFSVMDFEFKFDNKMEEPTFRAETDLHTATTCGTISQEGGAVLKFKAWVSAVENMMFIEFTTDGDAAIPWQARTEVMRDESNWEMNGKEGEKTLYLRREFTDGTPPTGMSMCVKRFGTSGRRPEINRKSPQLVVFAADSLSKNPGYAGDVIKMIETFEPDSVAAKYEAHKKWWAEFWAKSFVEIPDKLIEQPRESG